MRTRLVKSKASAPLKEILNEVMDCPLCNGESTLMVETTITRSPTDPPSEDTVEEYLENYLCMQCGYTTTSDMVVASDFEESAKKASPQLVRDLSIADNVRNLVWFPSIVNIVEKGICYPDGVPTNWMWVVAPYKPLTKEECESYLSDEDPTKYKWRLAIEKSARFNPLDFQNAMAYLGALVEKQND